MYNRVYAISYTLLRIDINIRYITKLSVYYKLDSLIII